MGMKWVRCGKWTSRPFGKAAARPSQVGDCEKSHGAALRLALGAQHHDRLAYRRNDVGDVAPSAAEIDGRLHQRRASQHESLALRQQAEAAVVHQHLRLPKAERRAVLEVAEHRFGGRPGVAAARDRVLFGRGKGGPSALGVGRWIENHRIDQQQLGEAVRLASRRLRHCVTAHRMADADGPGKSQRFGERGHVVAELPPIVGALLAAAAVAAQVYGDGVPVLA